MEYRQKGYAHQIDETSNELEFANANKSNNAINQRKSADHHGK
jgi:hypothetical protein